jgi:signal transduction histidine kinase/CheY-like chemotaxis protein
MVTGYHNLGHLLLEKKQYDAAIRQLKIAEQLSQAMQSSPMMLRTVQTLAECYEAAGKIDLALQYRKKEQELGKEIFDSERQKSIEELQIQYETAEKDRINQEQKGKLLETELRAKKASIQFYVLFFSVLLVAIIAAAIFYFYYQRKLNLAKINQEKIRIFENVVHDIRTPLTLIHGPLQALKSKYSHEKEGHTYFGMIERNSEKLIRMVDELLDVSKIDKGKYQVAWSDGNLKEYLEVLLSDFQQEAQEKDIRLSSSLVLPAGNFRFPKDVVEKIVFNLLSNALKYTPPKSEVKMCAKMENEHLIIQIEDQGTGIAPREQAKIFERFYRLKEHQHYPGTGIGLAVVKEFVALVGGSIRLKSAINQGSRFEVSLPVQTSQDEQAISFESSENEKLQLLLCDDDTDLLTFVHSILASDYDVQAVNNGQEALAFIENNAPDAILSDVMMPELDGIGLLENLKTNPLWRSIPVVLFSAKAALESRLIGLEAGADYYIPKPFSPDELKLILRNITNKIEKNRSDFEHQKAEKKPFTERLRSENDYVNKATEFVIQNMDNAAYSVNELAADMCISRSQLHRKLTLYTGNSATQFIRMIRLEKAKDLLESNFGNVEEVAFACGFGSRSYFSSSFGEYFGEAPTDVLRKV